MIAKKTKKKPAARKTSAKTSAQTSKKNTKKKPAPKKDATQKKTKKQAPVTTLTATEIDALRAGIEARTQKLAPGQWNANPEDVQKSVAQLVLTLVEFLRQLMERQAIRRMEEGSFTDDETERVGLALMKLEQTIHELCDRFELSPDDLQLQLGPLGRLI